MDNAQKLSLLDKAADLDLTIFKDQHQEDVSALNYDMYKNSDITDAHDILNMPVEWDYEETLNVKPNPTFEVDLYDQFAQNRVAKLASKYLKNYQQDGNVFSNLTEDQLFDILQTLFSKA